MRNTNVFDVCEILLITLFLSNIFLAFCWTHFHIRLSPPSPSSAEVWENWWYFYATRNRSRLSNRTPTIRLLLCYKHRSDRPPKRIL